MNNVGAWFLRIAVLYLLAGIGLGLHMSASHNFAMAPVHAHFNLLGWVSMALFGLYYKAVPGAADSRLAKAHFAIYIPANLVQMIALYIFFAGNQSIEPVLAISSMLVGLAVVIFAVNVWKYVK